MESIITLFEHEKQEFNWDHSHLKAINTLRRQFNSDIFKAITHQGKYTLQATQYVGVFQLGKQRIEVLPKLYKEDCQNKPQQSRHNLFYLLEYTGLSFLKTHFCRQLLQQDLNWLELLTRLFAISLQQQLDKESYHTYQTIEDTLPVLKGKWRLNEQLRYPSHKHQFYVAYDEFTIDNPINRIFRYTVEQLLSCSKEGINRRLLKNCLRMMNEVTLLPKITVKDIDGIPITRLNQSYESLLQFSRLFLLNQGLSLSSGSIDTLAFTFDMNQVFERFIYCFLHRHRKEILPDRLKDSKLLYQTQGHRKYLAKNSQDKGKFKLKPDIAIYQNQTYSILLDSKYKLLKANNSNFGISSQDFYQMIAYAYRYNCPLVILIYPQTANLQQPIREDFKLIGSDKIIRVATVDVRGDLSQKEERQRLIQAFRDIIN